MKATPTQTLERIASAIRSAANYEGREFVAHLSGALFEIQKGLPTGQQNKVRSMCNAARRANGKPAILGTEWNIPVCGDRAA
jgi:hypothetical protein